MSNDSDQVGGTPGEGMPEAPPPAAEESVRISNTGSRIAAILVVLVAIGAGVAALWWHNQRRQEIERHEEVQAAFNKVHAAGYDAFWSTVQIDVKELKTNQDFELRVKAILRSDATRYAEHLKAEAIPVLENALPAYKELTAPVEYAAEAEGVAKAAEDLLAAWKEFDAEIVKYKTFFEGKNKLQKSGDAWLGAQGDPDNEKFKIKAINYVHFVRCVLADKGVMFEIDPQEVGDKIEETCREDRAQWFRRVVDDCMPLLVRTEAESDEYYDQTLAKYRKAEMPDTKSVFGIKTCIDKCRDAMESEIIERIALAWANYIKAQNALLDAIDARLEELQ